MKSGEAIYRPSSEEKALKEIWITLVNAERQKDWTQIEKARLLVNKLTYKLIKKNRWAKSRDGAPISPKRIKHIKQNLGWLKYQWQKRQEKVWGIAESQLSERQQKLLTSAIRSRTFAQYDKKMKQCFKDHPNRLKNYYEHVRPFKKKGYMRKRLKRGKKLRGHHTYPLGAK